MEDVDIIYKNNLGIAFTWKKCILKEHCKINLVFKNIALHYTNDELIHFTSLIDEAFVRASNCSTCVDKTICKSILLETPVRQISFTTSYSELEAIKDLVTGTRFILGLDQLIQNL